MIQMGHIVAGYVFCVLSELPTARSGHRKAHRMVDFVGYFLEAALFIEPGGIPRVSGWFIFVMHTFCS